MMLLQRGAIGFGTKILHGTCLANTLSSAAGRHDEKIVEDSTILEVFASRFQNHHAFVLHGSVI